MLTNKTPKTENHSHLDNDSPQQLNPTQTQSVENLETLRNNLIKSKIYNFKSIFQNQGHSRQDTTNSSIAKTEEIELIEITSNSSISFKLKSNNQNSEKMLIDELIPNNCKNQTLEEETNNCPNLNRTYYSIFEDFLVIEQLKTGHNSRFTKVQFVASQTGRTPCSVSHRFEKFERLFSKEHVKKLLEFYEKKGKVFCQNHRLYRSKSGFVCSKINESLNSKKPTFSNENKKNDCEMSFQQDFNFDLIKINNNSKFIQEESLSDVKIEEELKDEKCAKLRNIEACIPASLKNEFESWPNNSEVDLHNQFAKKMDLIPKVDLKKIIENQSKGWQNFWKKHSPVQNLKQETEINDNISEVSFPSISAKIENVKIKEKSIKNRKIFKKLKKKKNCDNNFFQKNFSKSKKKVDFGKDIEKSSEIEFKKEYSIQNQNFMPSFITEISNNSQSRQPSEFLENYFGWNSTSNQNVKKESDPKISLKNIKFRYFRKKLLNLKNSTLKIEEKNFEKEVSKSEEEIKSILIAKMKVNLSNFIQKKNAKSKDIVW